MTKKKITLITIVILLIITVVIILVLNKIESVKEIENKSKLKEETKLFTYEVEDNQNEENIKILVTINSTNGLEYIETPKEKIECYGKNVLTIDYGAPKNSTNIFKIKQQGITESEEKIVLNDETIHDNGLSLDKTAEEGTYKVMTIKNTLSNLKSIYSSYYYKIGENGTWVDAKSIVDDGTFKISSLDYDLKQNNLINTEDNTVTVYAKITDDKNNTIIVSKKYNVNATETDSSIEAESLLEAVKSYNSTQGKYNITVNGETYNTKIYAIDGDLTIENAPTILRTIKENGKDKVEAKTELGNESDVATSTSDMAKNMVILKVNGNLTIEDGATLTAYTNKDGYGGPKGMLIYCTGTLTNNGTISMTARGAYAEGQNVYLSKNTDGTYEYVPAIGAEGGASVTATTGETINGNNGIDANARATGGGGSGFAQGCPPFAWYQGTSIGGAGSSGTSFSGGSGGAAAISYAYGSSSTGGAGSQFGGAGGIVDDYSENSGTGNPYGGTGGLLLISSKTLFNKGNIVSNGTNRGTSSIYYGGSSGGGSINIFYTEDYTNEGNIEANGGISPGSGNNSGGSGGTGSISIGNISTGTYINTYKNY